MAVGRYRVVRRMLAAVGLPCLHLHRSHVGPIGLRLPRKVSGHLGWWVAGHPYPSVHTRTPSHYLNRPRACATNPYTGFQMNRCDVY